MADKKGSGGRKRVETGSGSDKPAKPTSTKPDFTPDSASASSDGVKVGSGQTDPAKPESSSPKVTEADSAKTPASKAAAEKATDAKTETVKLPPTSATPAKPIGGQGASGEASPSATPVAPSTEPERPDATAKRADRTASGSGTTVPKTTASKSAQETAPRSAPSNTTTSTAKTAPSPTPAPAPRRGGFLSLFLGGVCAAAIGFGAAYYILPETGLMTPANGDRADMAAQIEDQSRRITELQDQIEALPAASDTPDLGGLETGQQQLEERLTDLAQQIGAFDTRLNDLEARPVAEGGGGVSPSELNTLRDALAAQTAKIDALSDEAEQRDNAERASAQQDMRRAALARIRTALDTGSDFAPALDDLERAGMSAPEALQAVAENGVATQAALQENFAPVARAALAAARKTDEGSETGFWSFMSDQLGARSLEPREGTDADAVLSRAEDNVRKGDLASALSEIEALPEPSQAELADWVTRARARMEALAAYDALAAKLN